MDFASKKGNYNFHCRSTSRVRSSVRTFCKWIVHLKLTGVASLGVWLVAPIVSLSR
jgi:hypothetical protein